MRGTDFETRLMARYGDGEIPKEDVGGIIEEAIENNVIERDEVGRWEHGKYTVAKLLQLMRMWRTDFLRESFSINDISCKDEGQCSDGGTMEDKPRLECYGERANCNDTFVTTEEAFLSSLRDKTRVITSRGSGHGRRVVRGVLKAWEEYEGLSRSSRKCSKRWWLLLVFLGPLYFLYVQKPF